jgi:regulatory protein
MQRAGHLLSSRPRTEQELRTRIGSAGFDRAVVQRVIDRLLELRLVDDDGFARQWVEERAIKKGRGRAALVAELVAKGIDRAAAEEAVSHADIDEVAQAAALAARFLPQVADRPLPRQAEALLGRLLRRGFSEEIAEEAVSSVLPPEGWD